MLNKVAFFLTMTFMVNSTYAEDCFKFETVKASSDTQSNYQADIRLKRIPDGKLFTISNSKEESFKQAVSIFNEVFNLTDSKQFYSETKDQAESFELENSSINGVFGAIGYENLKLCSFRYVIKVSDWSVYFEHYEIAL